MLLPGVVVLLLATVESHGALPLLGGDALGDVLGCVLGYCANAKPLAASAAANRLVLNALIGTSFS